LALVSCKEGSDPRNAGSCYRCGRVIEPAPERDRDFETETLKVAGELCERVHGKQPLHYARVVVARLEQGEQEYGHAYLDRDNIAEACEESPDIGAYLLLELQRLRPLLRDEDWQDLRMLALDAMAGAAAVHESMLRLQRLRDEVLA
jgi:hypothetical protein